RVLEIDARFTKTLRQVDAMPIVDAVRPVEACLVNLLTQVEKPGLAGPVVEPVNALEIVAGPDPGPVTGKEVCFRDLELPLKVACHEGEDPAIVRVFVIGLQNVEHDHVRPQVRLALERCLEAARSEPAVRLLAGKDGIDPAPGLLDDGFVLEDVAEIAVSFQ